MRRVSLAILIACALLGLSLGGATGQPMAVEAQTARSEAGPVAVGMRTAPANPARMDVLRLVPLRTTARQVQLRPFKAPQADLRIPAPSIADGRFQPRPLLAEGRVYPPRFGENRRQTYRLPFQAGLAHTVDGGRNAAAAAVLHSQPAPAGFSSSLHCGSPPGLVPLL